jgi:long-chain acyl-CoA synthetase
MTPQDPVNPARTAGHDARDDMTLGNVLAEHRRSRPQELAIVDGKVRLTYAELGSRVERLGAALSQAGVGPGERVLWLGQNSFRLLELVLAAGEIGAMVCPVNWRQSAAEVQFCFDDLSPAVVVWERAQFAKVVQQLRPRCDATFLEAGENSGDQSYEAALSRAEPIERTCADGAWAQVIMYTAAHDGQPNGAMLTQQGLVASSFMHAAINSLFEERPVFLAASPMFHIATLLGVLSTFLLGGANVFLARVTAKDACDLIEAEHCTWAYLTGPSISQVAEIAAVPGRDLSSFLVPEAYVKADPRWAGLGRPATSPWARAMGAFGQTETTGIISYAALAHGAQGLAGRPSPWFQVRIVDPDGGEVGPGRVGEITARGIAIGPGYWNRPQLNERRLHDGWWHSGDLGRREPDGSLTFIGPMTRMIKSGKENIYPIEVERCLLEHPSVQDAAIVGVPDSVWEQFVLAVVVPLEGAELKPEAVIAHCKERIASYKKPRQVLFATELPRIGTQLDRNELDKRYGGGGYPGAGV